MRIGVISTVRGYSWAGSEELWYQASLCALRDGHSVKALVAKEMGSSSQMQTFRQAGGRIFFRFAMTHPRLDSLKENLFSTYRKFERGLDVILVSVGSLQDFFFTPGLIDFLQKSKTPVLLLCQFNSDLLRFTVNERQVLVEIFNKSKSQVFVSRHNLEVAQRQLAQGLPNAKVVYNPIKIILDNPSELPNGEIAQLACVARFETQWKGQDLLLKVLSVEKWKNRRWHLNLYGTGPDLLYINELTRFYGLENRITICGYQEDVLSIWKKNHLMVLASRGEGTPLAVLEAMMCGRGVVTTDVGGNREILKDGETGWIAETASILSFDNALERAWESRPRWEEIGKRAHDFARTFSIVDPGRQLAEALIKNV